MRVLNRKYRGKKYSTDVLAFPMREGHKVKGEKMFLGDIAISLDTARKNARVYQESFQRELARYLIHGLLHLSGKRDGTPRAFAAMKREEEKLLRQFNKIELIK